MRARRTAPRRSRGEQTPIIRVSEIGEYGYCSRAWWYRHIVKFPITDAAAQGRLVVGTRAHRRHGAWVLTGARLRTVGIALALCGLAALIVAVWRP
ncbi:MAG: hypothetical protein ACJ78Q_01700 [Chloroflexia bacterium]